MSAFPNFSNVPGYVKTELNARKENVSKITKIRFYRLIPS